MIPFVDGVVEPTLWFLVDWSLRWAALIGILAVWLVIFRPRRAATRYVICCAVLLAGLSIPLLPRWGSGIQLAASPPPSAPVEPAVDVPVQAPRVEPIRRTDSDTVAIPPSTMHATPEPAPPVSAAAQPTPEPLGIRRLVILSIAALWLGGITVYAVRWAAGCWFLHRMRRTTVNLSGRPVEIFAACRAELGSKRQIAFAAHPNIHSPLSLGIFRPVVLVPANWTQEPEYVQRSSLLHEIAHLARYDDWMAILMELVRAVFWFHPLVRWLLAAIEHYRELLCDETAVSRGIDPREYAQVLLQFARRPNRLLPAGANMPSYPLRFGRRRTVKVRIEHLLEENMQRWIGPLSRRRALALATVVIGIAVGLGCARVQSKVESQKLVSTEASTGATPDAKSMDFVPYRIRPFDVLKVRADGQLLSKFDPNGTFMVEADGQLAVGGLYGRLKVGGLSIDEANKLIKESVAKLVGIQDVSLVLVGHVAKWAQDESRKHPYLIRPRHVLLIRGLSDDVLERFRVNGRYVVDPDGKIAIGEFYAPGGRLPVHGMTLQEANETINRVVNAIVHNQTLTVTLGGWEELWTKLEEDDDKEKPTAQALPQVPKEELRYGGKSFDDWRRELLTELKPELRIDGIKAMAEFGANGYGPEAVEVIGEIAKSVHSEDQLGFRHNTIRTAIRRIGPPAAPYLLRSLSSSDRNLRRFAAATIGFIIPHPKEAIPALTELVNDDDSEIRALAIEAALAIDFASSEVQKALAKALKDSAPRVRKSAVDAIRPIDKSKIAVPMLAEALKDSGPETKKQIISILSEMGAGAKAAIPALIEEAIRNPSYGGMVLSAVKKIEADKSKVAVLLAEMLKTAPVVRRDREARAIDTAFNALKEYALDGDAKAAVPVLIEILKTRDGAKTPLAVAILESIGPDANDAIPELELLIDSRETDNGLRTRALQALPHIKK